jgi:hypothetical protein
MRKSRGKPGTASAQMTRSQRTALLLFLLFVVLTPISAQDKKLTMSGIVTDSRSHQPVEGATVSVVGNKANPEVTDRNGSVILTFSASSREGEVVRVRVEKAGYRVYEVNTPISPTIPIQFSIDRILYKKKIPPTQRGRLQLADVTIIDTKQFPKLDFKVRNTGEVAFLKRAVFKVQNVWEIKSGMLPDAVPASWDYSLTLPVLETPYRVEHPISQVVKTNDVDRFLLTIGSDAPPSLTKYLYLASVDLIYDEDNKQVSSAPLLFVMPPASCVLGETSREDEILAALVHNSQVFDELGPFTGVSDEEATGLMRDARFLPDMLMEKLNSAVTLEEKLRSLKALGLLRDKAKSVLPLAAC